MADQKPPTEPIKLVLRKDFTHQELLDAINEDFANRLTAGFGTGTTVTITAEKHDNGGPGG